MEIINKKSNGYLLKEAYDQNCRILKKNNHTMIHSLIHLQRLQMKIQSLQQMPYLSWTFPFGKTFSRIYIYFYSYVNWISVAFFSVIAAINFLL
jgi:hypothetical protein